MPVETAPNILQTPNHRSKLITKIKLIVYELAAECRLETPAAAQRHLTLFLPVWSLWEARHSAEWINKFNRYCLKLFPGYYTLGAWLSHNHDVPSFFLNLHIIYVNRCKTFPFISIGTLTRLLVSRAAELLIINTVLLVCRSSATRFTFVQVKKSICQAVHSWPNLNLGHACELLFLAISLTLCHGHSSCTTCHLVLCDVTFVSRLTFLRVRTSIWIEQRILHIGDESLGETAFLLSKINISRPQHTLLKYFHIIFQCSRKLTTHFQKTKSLITSDYKNSAMQENCCERHLRLWSQDQQYQKSEDSLVLPTVLMRQNALPSNLTQSYSHEWKHKCASHKDLLDFPELICFCA